MISIFLPHHFHIYSFIQPIVWLPLLNYLIGSHRVSTYTFVWILFRLSVWYTNSIYQSSFDFPSPWCIDLALIWNGNRIHSSAFVCEWMDAQFTRLIPFWFASSIFHGISQAGLSFDSAETNLNLWRLLDSNRVCRWPGDLSLPAAQWTNTKKAQKTVSRNRKEEKIKL